MARQNILERLQQGLNDVRKDILNVTQAITPEEKWPFVRSRILRAIGRNGFEGLLIALLSGDGSTNGKENQNEAGQSF
jgi:hypothetical protein